MTNTELVLNMLAELSTKQISESSEPEAFLLPFIFIRNLGILQANEPPVFSPALWLMGRVAVARKVFSVIRVILSVIHLPGRVFFFSTFVAYESEFYN